MNVILAENSFVTSVPHIRISYLKIGYKTESGA